MAGLLDRLNWVDLLALILLIRISYVSSRIGVGKQILPSILLVFILSVSLYYYKSVADFFTGKYSFAPSLLRFFVYISIVIIFSVIYHIISRITGSFFPAEETESSAIEKIGGCFLGLFRSTVIIGILMTSLLLAPVQFVEGSLKKSYSGLFFITTSLRIYTFTVNPFLKKEKLTVENELARLTSEKQTYLLKPPGVKNKSRFFKKESYE